VHLFGKKKIKIELLSYAVDTLNLHR